MFNAQIISIVFKLLNFFGLFYLFFYLFKKNLLGLIREAIAQKKNAFINLVKKDKELSTQCDELDGELVEQKKEYAQLNKKIATWNDSFTQELAARDTERGQIEKSIKEKVAQKKYFIAQEQMQKLVIPAAVKGARVKLEEKFASEEKGRVFLKDIIKSLERKA